MKREDLRTKLIAAGINEENLASVVDYIMAANGADVEGFKKEQLAVLMCGDGANDCMALRTATIGVSLSEEEASIAAPFTSKNQNISCIIPLLKEGKSSLVTSIQTFKYMMMYSLVQFLCVTMLMVLNSYLSENQFLSVDIFIIIPLAFFIPATGPYKHLTKHHPTDSLISYPVISSILSQTLIAFIFQLAAHYILVFLNHLKVLFIQIIS